MLVVDTNIIAYLFLPTEFSDASERLLELDEHWIAPLIWRSEFRNILALYMRKNIVDLSTAIDIQYQAEEILSGNEFHIASDKVLSLAKESGCAAYDCEFVALAQSFEVSLITTDRKLIRTFPDVAMAAKDYIEGKS